MAEAPLQKLTPAERQNLGRVSKGGAVSDVMYQRLATLGLIRREFRDWVLTPRGQAHLAAQNEQGEDET